jgi:hypothetical protein
LGGLPIKKVKRDIGQIRKKGYVRYEKDKEKRKENVVKILDLWTTFIK